MKTKQKPIAYRWTKTDQVNYIKIVKSHLAEILKGERPRGHDWNDMSLYVYELRRELIVWLDQTEK